MYDVTVNHINELQSAAQLLLNTFPNEKVFLLNGQMGAGKTTFIKELCLTLGITDGMSSPTYSIVNEYKGEKELIYHFDLYRLKSTEECLDLGFEEYVNSGHYCFIEWPELARPLLPQSYVEVEILTENETRHIKAQRISHGI
ncbi:MAG: tsaE [Bacteroidetes bacterium]|jgi:tRNA threonylcarbamoyladenosine biosynthesis protein TsaE|nr:tsaE [Bacteroidota bacterium]